jgi:hypothetical protein
MIASAARFRIKSAWVIGLTGVLTVIAAVVLMAYAAPAGARSQVGPAPGGALLSVDLIHRPPAPPHLVQSRPSAWAR